MRAVAKQPSSNVQSPTLPPDSGRKGSGSAMSNKSSPKRQKSIQITKPENTQMNFAKLLHDIETDPGAEGPSPDERLPGSLKSKYALKFKYDTDQYIMNANRVSPNFLCLTIFRPKSQSLYSKRPRDSSRSCSQRLARKL